MLYKKYHRNFVRKFKRGTKFEYTSRFNHVTYQYCCTGELMIEQDRCCGSAPWILTSVSGRFSYCSRFTLIFVDGVIEKVNWINCNKNNYAV